MASFFRRRRSLLIKAIIVIPVLWFLAVLILGHAPSLSLGGRAEEEDGGVGLVPDLSKSDRREDLPLEPPDNANPDRKIHEDKEVGQQVRDVKEEEESIRRREEEERRKQQEEEEAERRRKEAALKFESEKRARERQVDPNAPGENGKGINIDKNSLSMEDRKRFDEGWQKNAYNQLASDMMSLHRSLPDVRDAECRDVKYRDALPDTSVVVCFHNEAWSVLLRTVHSILDRSPPHLLKEIILVDDFSDMDHLKAPLEEYVAKLEKVKVVRTKQREGLIRARLLGFSSATAGVVTFLDSHCECTEGWLEPLLDRIAADKSNVVCPVIDVIEDESLRYQYGSAKATSIGGFDWNLQFTWHGIPDYERHRRGSDIAPVRYVQVLSPCRNAAHRMLWRY